MRLLHVLFQGQAREMAARVTLDGDAPDTRPWSAALASAARPVLLGLFQAGMGRSEGWKRAQRSSPLLLALADNLRRHHVPDAFGVRKGLRDQKYAPGILGAVDAMVLTLSQETMDTLRVDVATLQRRAREAVKRGHLRGNVQDALYRSVRRMVADPMRARRIAQTETVRVESAGQLHAAKASGLVSAKEWMASSASCEKCRALDGKQVPLDEPFIVLGSGVYDHIMHPPYHCHCSCVWQEVL